METPKGVSEVDSSFSQEKSRKKFWDGISLRRAAKLFLLGLIAASTTKAIGVSVMETDIKGAATYLSDAGLFTVVAAGIYAMEKLATRVRSNSNKPKF